MTITGIATTDGRLIRRMVRDARTRGASATHTLRMWASVRRGEEENIFPFQESADAMFNSALLYELAVLKQFAEPLLYSVGKDEPEYFEAKRLLKFLEYFLGVSSENLPNNSIVREFVGRQLLPACRQAVVCGPCVPPRQRVPSPACFRGRQGCIGEERVCLRLK